MKADRQRPPAPEQQAGYAAEVAADCAQCGACMSVCPVYKAGRREELVARGKLRLLAGMQEGVVSPDPELMADVSRCLLCGRCTGGCPNLVPATEGLQAGRVALARAAGVPLVKKLMLGGALSRPRALDLAARAGRLAGMGLGAVPEDSGLLLRLPGLEQAKRLPVAAARPFLADAPREIPGPAGKPRLGFFVGCVANYLRPQLAQKVLRVLSRRFTVVIPPDQGCCGLPALSAGLEPTARDLAQRHLRAFAQAKVDLVVTACGSCAHTLVKEWPQLAGEAARPLAESVREVSQVLAEEPALLKALGPAPGAHAVAVHDPCHLGVGLGVTQEPRAMLSAAGVEVAEMAGADLCCGGGGLFAVNEPELSAAIFAPRAQAFAATGAPVLATSCSGCWLQWRRGLDSSSQVAHPIELLGE